MLAMNLNGTLFYTLEVSFTTVMTWTDLLMILFPHYFSYWIRPIKHKCVQLPRALKGITFESNGNKLKDQHLSLQT